MRNPEGFTWLIVCLKFHEISLFKIQDSFLPTACLRQYLKNIGMHWMFGECWLNQFQRKNFLGTKSFQFYKSFFLLPQKQNHNPPCFGHWIWFFLWRKTIVLQIKAVLSGPSCTAGFGILTSILSIPGIVLSLLLVINLFMNCCHIWSHFIKFLSILCNRLLHFTSAPSTGEVMPTPPHLTPSPCFPHCWTQIQITYLCNHCLHSRKALQLMSSELVSIFQTVLCSPWLLFSFPQRYSWALQSVFTTNPEDNVAKLLYAVSSELNLFHF